jgi:hypothetical protein
MMQILPGHFFPLNDASGGQGGFFEKPPPWTPRKTFV